MLTTMGPQDPARRRELAALRAGTPPTPRDDAPAVGSTLTGYDLSSNNTTAQLATALGSDFVIIKATEGVGYRNPFHDSWIAQARVAGRLVGHYHYAHPESNSAAAEAAAFVKMSAARPGDVMVLDFEPGQILPAYPTWVLAFADAVTAATRAPCWLYTNNSQGTSLMSLASPAQRTALAGLPLWKAYYQSAIGSLMGWPDWTCWQYTDTPLDTNRFNGDAMKWRALGVPGGGMVHTRTTWRGVVTCTRGAAAFEAACRLHPQGDQIQATQGSFTTSTGASGGTHAGCGVVDLARFRKDGREWTWTELVSIVNCFRQVGCFGWPREILKRSDGSLVWPRHAHVGAIGCPELAAEAVQQVRDYKAGKDGLLPRDATTGISLNPDTPGCTRAYVNVTWETYEQDGFLMGLSDAQQTETYNGIRELLNILRTGRRDGDTKVWPYNYTPIDRTLSLLAEVQERVDKVGFTDADRSVLATSNNILRTGRVDGSPVDWPYDYTPMAAILDEVQQNQDADAIATAVATQLAATLGATLAGEVLDALAAAFTQRPQDADAGAPQDATATAPQDAQDH